MSKPVRHILSLSGGKDSAALAIHMRDRGLEMEYIFHDTGKELPETYEYLGRLEAHLGQKIHKTTSGKSFEQWLKVYGEMLPSNHRRWCTRMMKLKPFEEYIGEDPCFNYIGLRADEKRDGYISLKPNITPVYPFREDGLVKADIERILEESSLGMPPYTEWGRTRSGCFFCFYQQKIEWVRLKETHPDLFEEAKSYEEPNKKGVTFLWNGEESLANLERPERIEQIKLHHAEMKERERRNAPNKTLLQVLGGAEDDYEGRESCLMCHK